jgi:hypothetical protein
MQAVFLKKIGLKPAKIRHLDPAWKTVDFSLPKTRAAPRRQPRRLAESRQGGIATSLRFTPPPLTCTMI